MLKLSCTSFPLCFINDVVGLALDGDGLAGQHLDAVVRAVEEDTAAGNHAELEELFRVLHRVLEQLPLHVF